MEIVTTELSISLKTIECCECSITFAVTSFFYDNRKNSHKEFYCPNGHAQYFAGKSDVEKLREKLADEQRKLSQAQFEIIATKQRTEAVEREKARLQNRIKNGACPCCHRQFSQLSRHMKSKHPEFSK